METVRVYGSDGITTLRGSLKVHVDRDFSLLVTSNGAVVAQWAPQWASGGWTHYEVEGPGDADTPTTPTPDVEVLRTEVNALKEELSCFRSSFKYWAEGVLKLSRHVDFDFDRR